MIRFTEIYYNDAERLALYLSAKTGSEIIVTKESSEKFPLPPKFKTLPPEVDALLVGDCEIAYIENGENPDARYRDRNLHRVVMGDKIREIRGNTSLERLSELTGIKARNLENIENGRFDATIDILSNIAGALGYHIEFIPN